MRGIVLVVDDHKRPRRVLTSELEDAGYAVVQAGSGSEAWQLFCRHRPDVVITDLVMPRGNGLDLLQRIRVRSDVPVILFTARGSLQHAAAAFKGGADEFVASDAANIDELVALVDRARDGRKATPEHPEIASRLIGASVAMRRVRDRISALAPLRTPVLVSGEPGTGRRTSVECLHELGNTGGEETLQIRCERFQPGERLPPTGAIHLAGVERLNPDAQAYWRKKLASGEAFARRVRVFATASESLTEATRLAGFDPELARIFERFSIELPPLRDRLEDVPAIADALAARIGRDIGRRVKLSYAAKQALAERRWPGNCSELARVVERCVAFSRHHTVRLQLVEEVLAEQEPTLAEIREHSRLRERESLLAAIQSAGGNISLAARTLGRSRGSLYRLIEKHGIPLAGSRT
jgi:DNA-binding NtrC family response regulator